ncbi:MAG: hypothetical protein ABR525_04845 [Candidatus Limnocylindria bacterium]
MTTIAMRAMPEGDVTFLFSDIEGSTRMLGDRPALYAAALLRHDEIMRGSVERSSGVIFETVGDAVYAAFSEPIAGAQAALDSQLALAHEDWGELGSLRIRMALHGGAVERRRDHYFGAPLYRCARLMSIGHGGQTLLSRTTADAIGDSLPHPAGLRPMGTHRLKDLADPEVVFQLTHPGLQSTFAPLRSLAPATNTLPTQLTSLVGRRRELAETGRLLAATRLLTLTGPGGTGKTRLAVALGTEAAGRFDDGVIFVPLAATRDAELVGNAIALALDITEKAAEPLVKTLVSHLEPKELLLLLDNFEQVVQAAPLVARLLSDCPRLTIIATSRVRLNVSGEQRYEVPPLAVTTPALGPGERQTQSEAVTLFLQRALAVRPDLQLAARELSAIATICARLDGLPLSIELAAARTRTLSPEGILSRLSKRLTLLTGGGGDLPQRQRTLRGAIDWSHELLGDAERTLFRRLAAFAGGFALDDAQGVCASGEQDVDVFESLERLVDHSLVGERIQPDGQPRFQMLETVREYAQERLAESGEAENIRRRHAEVYLGFAERGAPELTAHDRRRWLDGFEREHENFRAALACAVDSGDVNIALRLGACLWRFWQMHGHLREGDEWLRRVLALPAMDQSHARDNARARVNALIAAGGIAYWQEDMDAAHRSYAEAVAVARELGDKALLAEALYNLSFGYTAAKEKRPAIIEECVALYRELGDQGGIARTLLVSGGLLYEAGAFEKAQQEFEEGLAIAQSLGDAFVAAGILHLLGNLAESRGDAAIAEARLYGSLELAERAGDVSAMALVLGDLARLALRAGRVDQGGRLSAASAAIRRTTGVQRISLYELINGPSEPPDLADPRVAAAWAEGERMDPSRAVRYALHGEL